MRGQQEGAGGTGRSACCGRARARGAWAVLGQSGYLAGRVGGCITRGPGGGSELMLRVKRGGQGRSGGGVDLRDEMGRL
jgi:hypothetical protein